MKIESCCGYRPIVTRAFDIDREGDNFFVNEQEDDEWEWRIECTAECGNKRKISPPASDTGVLCTEDIEEWNNLKTN